MATHDIDWRKDGYQARYLSLPNSTNASAWATVRIPIHIFRGGDGPVTLLLGGCHGDEYEAPVALANLAGELRGMAVQGTVIVVPSVNLPATLSGTRLSPLDGLNLNREFPGNPRGSVTQRLAHAISTQLVPLCDHVIDLHSGGRSLNFVPCMFIHEQENPDRNAVFLAAAACFPTEYVLVTREAHADLMLDDVVEKAGKLMVSSELGGSGTLTPGTAHIALRGLRTLLVHLGHIEDCGLRSRSAAQRIVRVPGAGSYIYADHSGVIEPCVVPGEIVEDQQVIAYSHQLDRLDVPPQPVRAPHAGLVVALNGQGAVHRGDVIAVIGQFDEQSRAT